MSRRRSRPTASARACGRRTSPGRDCHFVSFKSDPWPGASQTYSPSNGTAVPEYGEINSTFDGCARNVGTPGTEPVRLLLTTITYRVPSACVKSPTSICPPTDLTRLCSSGPEHPWGTSPKWYTRSDFNLSSVGPSFSTCRL